jgi:hypothetical protein
MTTFWDSVFGLVFGRPGPAKRAPAPPPAPPAAPPPAPPAPPPIAASPPPPPAAPPPPPPAEAPPETTAEAPPAPETTTEPPAPVVEPAPAPAEQPKPKAEDFLTPHFQLIEFIRSETAQSKNIDNMPPADKLANVRTAAEGMEKVRALLGDKPISISSGFRCPELNHAVGGSATSDHMQGFSVDFRCDAFGPPYQIVEHLIAIPDLMDRVDQIIFEKSRWVHISFAPERRKQVLTAYEAPGQSKTLYVAGLKRLDGVHLDQA